MLVSFRNDFNLKIVISIRDFKAISRQFYFHFNEGPSILISLKIDKLQPNEVAFLQKTELLPLSQLYVPINH